MDMTIGEAGEAGAVDRCVLCGGDNLGSDSIEHRPGCRGSRAVIRSTIYGDRVVVAVDGAVTGQRIPELVPAYWGEIISDRDRLIDEARD